MTEQIKSQKVYEAISEVMQDLCELGGIAKDQANRQQGYNFRGIDDVYNVLAPILSKRKLVILPNVLERACTERPTKSGGVLFFVALKVEFQIVSAMDASSVRICTYGEAMDSADKATNKALSAAYKYAMFQTFCIPVEVEDADATTPEPAAKSQTTARPTGTKPTQQQPAKTEATAQAPWSMNQKAEWQNAVSNAADDVALYQLTKDLYQARALLGEHGPEMARQVADKRASVVTAGSVLTFEKGLSALAKEGLLGEVEVKAFSNAARSRLNMDLVV